MRESTVESYFKARVKERGGSCRKVQWIGRRGAPDRRLFGACWVEFKRPGEKLDPHQKREHARMEAAGEWVEVVDSLAAVDVLMRYIYGY